MQQQGGCLMMMKRTCLPPLSMTHLSLGSGCRRTLRGLQVQACSSCSSSSGRRVARVLQETAASSSKRTLRVVSSSQAPLLRVRQRAGSGEPLVLQVELVRGPASGQLPRPRSLLLLLLLLRQNSLQRPLAPQQQQHQTRRPVSAARGGAPMPGLPSTSTRTHQTSPDARQPPSAALARPPRQQQQQRRLRLPAQLLRPWTTQAPQQARGRAKQGQQQQ